MSDREKAREQAIKEGYGNYNFPELAKSLVEGQAKREAEKKATQERKKAAQEEREERHSKYMTMDEMKMKSGGKVSSASKRADGCAQRGKTKGRMV